MISKIDNKTKSSRKIEISNREEKIRDYVKQKLNKLKENVDQSFESIIKDLQNMEIKDEMYLFI